MSTKFYPKNLKNQTQVYRTIALLLMICIAMPLAVLPTTNAATAQKQTYAYIGALPNPAGIGQDVLLHVGITDASNWEQGPWTGLTVEVTKPDGSKETLGPFTTDLTGGTGAVYNPEMVGTYKFQTHCPDQGPLIATIRGTADAGTLLLGSSSDVLELTVQEEMPPAYPGFSMPSEYWTRPIDSQIREWSSIAGSWVASPPNLYAPYNDGPESAHILWTRPLEMGGLVGGDLDGHSMEMGDAYEGKFINSVIIDGVLYYNKINTQGRGSVPIEAQEIIAVDLHTGEELWMKPLVTPDGDVLSLSFGQTFYWDAFNVHGVYTYLWATSGSTWHAFDAFTGDWSYTVTDVPSGSNVYGAKGEIYRYTVDLRNGWMSLWNSTRTVNPQETSSSQDGSWGRYLNTAAYPRVFPAERGIQWNVTIPTNLPGSVVATFPENKVVGASITPTDVTMWALSLEAGKEGTVLYNEKWNAPAAWADGNQTIQWMTGSEIENVGVMFSKETCQNYGFNLETGEYMWGPTTPQHYLDALDDTKAGARIIAYGNLYSASVSGILYCYDIETGVLKWKYEANDTYTEILWANTWWLRPLFATDGKIYVGHYEHSAIDPRPRGAPFICVDAETGDVVWTVDGMFRQTRWGGRAIIGDSIIATMDTYDQRVYAIGKGPSATTVDAPMTDLALGNKVVISGTVTDISPGTSEYALTARFPNGVPAVSDESMSDWMLYVYKHFTKPTDTTGVTVHLTAIDPNCNTQDIGYTTSDSLGNYAITWEPPVPGLYTVTATFEGTNSYYGSEAGTYFFVTEANAANPSVTATPTPTTTDQPTPPAQTASPAPSTAPPPTSETPTTTYIAIAVAAIIIVIAAAALVLRKRQ
ncbi:MAG: PQQ-binding-like beta-propeller repeat protein [Candidatus Bathyarchaeota archaeon]|nr:PQQ-binding-like beta-propeller repeat protein [Candidatus Bathyarchaeota archaeon]